MSLDNLQRKFSSFSELESFIQKYSVENKVHMYKRDAKKLERAGIKRDVPNTELLYYYLKYTCVHGGRAFRRSKGYRGLRKTWTLNVGCTFFMMFVLSKDGRYLELSRSNLSHSHPPIHESVFKLKLRKRLLRQYIQKNTEECRIDLSAPSTSRISDNNHDWVTLHEADNAVIKRSGNVGDSFQRMETVIIDEGNGSNPNERLDTESPVEQELISAIKQKPNRHSSFFNGIIPSLETFDDDEIVEFQLKTLQVISEIKKRKKASANLIPLFCFSTPRQCNELQ